MCEFEACMGSTALAPSSLAGRTKNGWDSTHSWSRCHFKPKPGYTTAAILALLSPSLPPSFRQWWESYNHVSREEQNKTGCAAVTELALTQTANNMRQGEWDSLCGLSLFFLGLWCVRWLLRLSSTCICTLMWVGRGLTMIVNLVNGQSQEKNNSSDMLAASICPYVEMQWVTENSVFMSNTWRSHPKLHHYISRACCADASGTDAFCFQWATVVTPLGGAEKDSTGICLLSQLSLCVSTHTLPASSLSDHMLQSEYISWPSCKALFRPLWGRAGLLGQVSW